MKDRIWAIALNTYREAVRQKVLYGLILFTVALLLFSLFLGQLSLGAEVKIIKDMGLASIMFFGAMISIFMGVGLVFREVDRKTIYTILSKPVSRSEFILGKFFGLAITIGFEVIIMSVLLFLLLSFYPPPIDFSLLKAILLIYVELCILIAAALVFSSYSSSFMSILFCLSFLVVGHMTDDLSNIMSPRAEAMIWKGEGLEIYLGYGLMGIVRTIEVLSLDHFVINSKIVHGVPIPWRIVFHSLSYGVGWILLSLSSSIFLFRRKDLA